MGPKYLWNQIFWYLERWSFHFISYAFCISIIWILRNSNISAQRSWEVKLFLENYLIKILYYILKIFWFSFKGNNATDPAQKPVPSGETQSKQFDDPLDDQLGQQLSGTKISQSQTKIEQDQKQPSSKQQKPPQSQTIPQEQNKSEQPQTIAQEQQPPAKPQNATPSQQLTQSKLVTKLEQQQPKSQQPAHANLNQRNGKSQPIAQEHREPVKPQKYNSVSASNGGNGIKESRKCLSYLLCCSIIAYHLFIFIFIIFSNWLDKINFISLLSNLINQILSLL